MLEVLVSGSRAARRRWGRTALVVLVALSGLVVMPAATAAPGVVTDLTTAASTDGSAMPVGDLPGWKQVTAEDFTGSVPLGSWTGSSYSRSLFAYSGYGDTTNRGWYDPTRVLSVKDGALDWYVHTADGKPRVAAVVPIIPATGWGQVYGRYSMRFRADSLENYKLTALLWPDSDNWGEGEVDFMEVGELAAGNAIYANLYPRGSTATMTPGTPTGFRSSTRADGNGWHVSTLEWSPGSVTYWLDGVKLGTTSLSAVPSTRMHLVVQLETAVGLPMPLASTEGHVQVDWITQYTRVESPVPTTPTSTTPAPTTPAPTTPVTTLPAPATVYRFWSPQFNNAHFFTMDGAEAQRIRTSDRNWTFEGDAYQGYPLVAGACASQTTAVYRFWSPRFQSHFFTASAAEKASVGANDPSWTYEGVAFCAATSQVPGSVPLYRFWSPRFGKHFYTADPVEAHQLDVDDPSWDAEGIAFFVQPSAAG